MGLRDELDALEIHFDNADGEIVPVKVTKEAAQKLVNHVQDWLDYKEMGGDIDIFRRLPGESGDMPKMEEIFKRSMKYYAWVGGIPFLKFDPGDCRCGANSWIYRMWKFHQRPSPRYPFRCDILLKCTECGHVTSPFGVVVPPPYKDMWEGRVRRRDVLNLLDRLDGKGPDMVPSE